MALSTWWLNLMLGMRLPNEFHLARVCVVGIGQASPAMPATATWRPSGFHRHRHSIRVVHCQRGFWSTNPHASMPTAVFLLQSCLLAGVNYHTESLDLLANDQRIDADKRQSQVLNTDSQQQCGREHQ